jgi:hypothetical protein
MRRKKVWVAVLGFLMLSLMISAGAFADGPKSKSSDRGSRGKSRSSSSYTKIELEADLKPTLGLGASQRSRDDDDDDDGDDDDDDRDNFGGEAKYSKLSINGLVQSERLEAKIELPFPSPGLSIVAVGEALLADFQLLLSNPLTPTVAYATCLLDLAEIEMKFFQDAVTKAEAKFKLDVRADVKNGVLLQKNVHGSCTIASSTSPTGVAGVPAVNSGDIATVVLTNAMTSTPVLVGTFKIDR